MVAKAKTIVLWPRADSINLERLYLQEVIEAGIRKVYFLGSRQRLSFPREAPPRGEEKAAASLPL